MMLRIKKMEKYCTQRFTTHWTVGETGRVVLPAGASNLKIEIMTPVTPMYIP